MKLLSTTTTAIAKSILTSIGGFPGMALTALGMVNLATRCARSATRARTSHQLNRPPRSFGITVRGLGAAAASLLFASSASWADCPCGTGRVTTYPAVESFESQPICTLDGLQCSLPCELNSTGIWQNIGSDDIDWTINSGGTSTPRTGPSFDATRGTFAGKYAYLESSCPDIGYPRQNAILYGSKCFNFEGIAAPELSYAYHMYGEEMGEVRVEASVDSCGTWQTVDSFAGPQQTSSSEGWRTRIVNLLPYAGRSGVRLRIRGISGGDQFSDLAIDDITLREAPCCDLAITNILSPGNKCGMSAQEQVTVELQNLGFLPQAGFPVSYSIDGGPLVTEIFTETIAPGASAPFTFETRANLAALGEHTISLFSGLNGDLRTTNDAKTITVVSIPTITSFPYTQNFESGKGGWTVTGTRPSWGFGTPAKSIISSAASGTKSWVTGGLDQSQYPDLENSAVLSPCFDFSSLGFPVISLKAWWNAEGGYDGAVLQSSIDGGQTWQRVGAVDDSASWYNNRDITAKPGGQGSGWTGSSLDAVPAGSAGWVSTGNSLAGLAGKPSVLLRVAFASDSQVRDDGFAFDDIVIRDGFSAQQTAAITLDANSNGRADAGDRITYTATLRNLSSRPITGVIFTETPNSNTSLIVGSVIPSSGVVQRGNASGNTDVRVALASLAANSTAVIRFQVAVRAATSTSGTSLCSQGAVVGNGFSPTSTDDPGVSGNFDPSCVRSYTDTDGDGVLDAFDRCPGFPDDQDADRDGIPDGCDRCAGSPDTVDTDTDGVPNGCDGCPNDPNKAGPAACGCGVADTDSDGDGVPNCLDQCASDSLKTAPGVCGCGIQDADTDGDGVAQCNDGCPIDPQKSAPGRCGCGNPDTDSDGDGTPNCVDQCPSDQNKSTPGRCGCGGAETDSDGDGTPNCLDQCPQDPRKLSPGTCGCGVADSDSNSNGITDCTEQCPDGSLTDSDGDGALNCRDGCPSDPGKTVPAVCGCGVAETDSDSDGAPDCIDRCPSDPMKTAPGSCGCGVQERDPDGDGTPSCIDQCPNDPSKVAPGTCGCSVPETDTDGDGVKNCVDECPSSSAKVRPGVCGCAVADTDSDADGTPDCNDLCPRDPLKTASGVCGCGTQDSDPDGDGVATCLDQCPNDSRKTSPGQCGCGVPDTDSDSDGVANCRDDCPLDPQKTTPGSCGCGSSDLDSDDDGAPNCSDGCPADPLKLGAGGCGCGVPDTDTDGDGTPDCIDLCAADPAKSAPGVCGCGVADIDTDGDGMMDCNDRCLSDPQKTSPGICGCGISDVDTDSDQLPDCQDGCPTDPLKGAGGQCGCGSPDTDSDGDGVPDCQDGCAADPRKVAGGVCGCGVGDTDSDKDGIPDCIDGCPSDARKNSAGICGCGVPETDSNLNGIPDCQPAKDLKLELTNLDSKIKRLAVFKGKRGPQFQLRTEIKKQLKALEQFIRARALEIPIIKGAKPLSKSFGAVKSSTVKMIILNDKVKLSLYKRNTSRMIGSLMKSVP